MNIEKVKKRVLSVILDLVISVYFIGCIAYLANEWAGLSVDLLYVVIVGVLVAVVQNITGYSIGCWGYGFSAEGKNLGCIPFGDGFSLC